MSAQGNDESRRILVTGGSGFLGSPCLELLVERGWQVHATSRRPPDGDSTIRWFETDLFDTQQVAELVAEVRPSHLLHLAWASGHEGFRDGVENYRWVGASLELLRHFVDQGGRRVVLTGTGAEYDWSDGECREDTTPLAPSSTYGLCKRAFSQLAERYLSQHSGVSGAWARLFFLYGPREDAYRLLPSMLGRLLQGEVAECTFSLLKRDYLFVLDAAQALVELVESDVQGAINLASGEALELGELVSRAADHVGRPELVKLGGQPTGAHPAPVVVANIERARRELGWQPRWSLGDALDHTLLWWRNNKREERS